ncbi:hypothetical protein [Pseudomonas sp. EL_65y_Pfl1_R32]|uniref:hypothetical protein n=1 Tax=Pseudomonas sp. EL_65y_Pfl1_R32 TaxID=3088696 RepID=UPI0030D9C888
MIKKRHSLKVGLLFLVCFNAVAAEIEAGDKPGSVVLHVGADEVLYENITGNQYGIDRSLVDINDSPALLVLSRGSLYFTLAVKGREVLVDCAYYDKRNNYNGARMTAGICGLNVPLSETYDDLAQNYSAAWRGSIFSFDTRGVFESKAGGDFLLGRIGEVEVFDRYSSASSLKNALPQKVIKSRSGCFNFGESVGFLVFINKDKPSLQYLDILRSEEPMRLQRMQGEDLKKIAVEKCT